VRQSDGCRFASRSRPALVGDSGLEPRIGDAVESGPSKKEKATDSRNLAPVMFRSDSKIAECRRQQLSNRCKQLGSSSEVECFRVQTSFFWALRRN
jgi:hypothetical protein